MPFATRSSSSARAWLLLAAVACAAVAVALYLAMGATTRAALALAAAVAAAALLALYLILRERHRHAQVEEELAGQASFLESLIESLNAIAVPADPAQVLEQARSEAERLFGAQARLLAAGEEPEREGDRGILLPLRVRDEELGALHLRRPQPFARADVAHATLLADFAARASDNARLLEETRVREAERARLSEQLITAEQDERRRLALFLHDGPVQAMAGVALMLDAVQDAVAHGRVADAGPVLARVLDQHRETIRALRDLSFNLEPVVLRDQGFGTAVTALAEQLGLEHEIQIDVDVDAADTLAEKAQAALYQIIRDALHGAIRRGPPTRVSVAVHRADGQLQAVIADDAPGERRRATFDALEERARTLNGRFRVEQRDGGGTTVSISLPAYAAQD